MTYFVRPLLPHERDRWLSLRKALWPTLAEELLREEQTEILADPQSNLVCLAQSVNGEIVGFAEFTLRDRAEGCTSRPVAYLEAWYVELAARRCGVGRALLEFGASWARGRGCTELASDTELSNTVSQAAHSALGFKEVLRLVLYAKSIEA